MTIVEETAAIDITTMLPATFTAPGLTDDQFVALGQKFPDAMIEVSSEGIVTVMPPSDRNTGVRTATVVFQLMSWALQQGRGRVCGPDASFKLPNGARRGPDASWFDGDPPDQRWPIFAPQFVIEVRSLDDRVRNLRRKMEEYIANGVQLGWLIDPFERTVTIYRPGREPEVLNNPLSVSGEGPVAGFVLTLDRIFS